jgi:hypothetical protein
MARNRTGRPALPGKMRANARGGGTRGPRRRGAGRASGWRRLRPRGTGRWGGRCRSGGMNPWSRSPGPCTVGASLTTEDRTPRSASARAAFSLAIRVDAVTNPTRGRPWRDRRTGRSHGDQPPHHPAGLRCLAPRERGHHRRVCPRHGVAHRGALAGVEGVRQQAAVDRQGAAPSAPGSPRRNRFDRSGSGLSRRRRHGHRSHGTATGSPTTASPTRTATPGS